MHKKCILFLFFLLLWALPANAIQGTLNLNILAAPPNLTATVQFFESSGSNVLDRSESGYLLLTIDNKGRGDAFGVTVEIQDDYRVPRLSFDQAITIGTLPTGQTAERKIALEAAEGIAAQEVELTLRIREANGFDAAPIKISIQTKAFETPELVIGGLSIDNQSGGDLVVPMKIMNLTVRIQNTGFGDARGVNAVVQTGSNVFIAGDSKTDFFIGDLAYGQFKDIQFMFYTNNRIAKGERIPIDIKLKETRPRFNAAHSLSLVMNTPKRSTQEVVFYSEETGSGDPGALAGGMRINVDKNIPEGQKAGKYDIAVVIGNRHYTGVGVPSVDFAVRGARVMREYLVRTFGYDPENIIYIENASLGRFNEVFGTERDHRGMLYNWTKKGKSRVFIYYAGHGAPDLDTAEAYLVPVDASPAHIRATGYSLQSFYDNLEKLPAKHITVVLDACFSGTSEGGMLFKGVSPAMLRVKKEYREPANAILFASAAVDQVATWYFEKRHSLFTYYFFKGIQGAADADKDGKITVGEMEHYLKENVPYRARRLSSREQHPVVRGNIDEVMVVFR